MLENIALSISTALFMLCAAIVNSIFPQSDTAVQTAAYTAAESADIDLIGKWNSAGRIIEFVSDSKLSMDGHTMTYSRDGDTLCAKVNINGEERIYAMTLERVSGRVIKLNGIPMYKIDPTP